MRAGQGVPERRATPNLTVGYPAAGSGTEAPDLRGADPEQGRPVLDEAPGVGGMSWPAR